MRKLCLLSSCLLSIGAASAATIEYDFETSANISPIGPQTAATVYTAPDTNTFGAGISVSSFTLTDRDASEYSRFVDIGSGSVNAAVGGGGTPLLASFTVTIDDTVVVDFTNIEYDSFFRFTTNNNDALITHSFSTSIGDNEIVDSWAKNTNADFWPNPDNTVSSSLSGLTGLTDTSVTFTWSFDDNKSNLFSVLSHGVDNITLTGTVAPVPEPSNFLTLGAAILMFSMRRRRG